MEEMSKRAGKVKEQPRKEGAERGRTETATEMARIRR